MKLAYLAHNKTSYKAHHALEQYFTSIDTYLIDQNDINDYDLLNLPIMTEGVLIPNSIELQTVKHKLILQDIKNEYSYLKKNILMNYNLQNEEVLGVKKTEKKFLNLNDVDSIEIDKTQNNYVIHIGNTTYKYDYLIIESNQHVSEYLLGKKQNVINKASRQSYSMLNLEFSVLYKLSQQHIYQEFVFIENTRVKSLIDNWYTCSIANNILRISLLIPNEQRNLAQYLSYIADHSRDMLARILLPFEIGDLINHSIIPIGGFVESDIKLKQTKNAAVVPTFLFWPPDRVNNYIQKIYIPKQFKNKNILMEKDGL